MMCELSAATLTHVCNKFESQHRHTTHSKVCNYCNPTYPEPYPTYLSHVGHMDMYDHGHMHNAVCIY